MTRPATAVHSATCGDDPTEPHLDRQGREDTACDEAAAYLIEWRQRECDLDTLPVSGCCERHALDVDRREVVRIRSSVA